MLPLAVTSSASTSSPLVSANPTSDPSKYIVQVPLVVLPRVVGVKARISSSAAPVTPVTVGLPVVEISTLPSGRTSSASIFSAPALKPTSTPLKYMLNVPAVMLNRTISLGVYVTPPRVTLATNDIRIVSASN